MTLTSDISIFIFHRDLRLYDNTTLINQYINEENVILIFIFTPDQIKNNKYISYNSVNFMINSLIELNNEIKKYNGKLYCFYGDTLNVLNDIKLIINIKSIGFNKDYTPYSINRDNLIIKWATENSIKIYNDHDFLLNSNSLNSTYVMFSFFYKYMINLNVLKSNSFKYKKISKLPNSHKIHKIVYDIQNIRTILNIPSQTSKSHDIILFGGRLEGLKLLDNINNIEYTGNLNDNTSLLSSHIHFNTISIREVYYASNKKSQNHEFFVRQLIWREFYINITVNNPHVLNQQINKTDINYAYKKNEELKIKWIYDSELFDLWKNGETGFPIVDACMRQLNNIGYLHNRGRMIVASFLCKDMQIDWRLGEHYFATKLVDYDPINNNAGWQWVAGYGNNPMPYFRIFNPWLQSFKYDKECIFIKKWIPELNAIPNLHIHNWNKFCNLYKNIYKHPILDHDIQKITYLKLVK